MNYNNDMMIIPTEEELKMLITNDENVDSIGFNELADELEDRLDKVESLMYIVNTQINKLEVNK